MIDVHSHIVFGVDDGAKNIEDSLEIIKEGYKAGFDRIIATPHFIKGYWDNDKSEIAKRISFIQNELNKINCNVEILQANEIYFDEDINMFLDNNNASSMCNSKYVLFELPLNLEILNIDHVIFKIFENGRIPVLAHPERYPFVKDNPNSLIPLIEQGVLMQANYGSILGQYGTRAKNAVKTMLKQNMVHLLGSDVHRTRK